MQTAKWEMYTNVVSFWPKIANTWNNLVHAAHLHHPPFRPEQFCEFFFSVASRGWWPTLITNFSAALWSKVFLCAEWKLDFRAIGIGIIIISNNYFFSTQQHNFVLMQLSLLVVSHHLSVYAPSVANWPKPNDGLKYESNCRKNWKINNTLVRAMTCRWSS